MTSSQRLHLLNSSHIQNKLEQSRLVPMLEQSTKTPREIAVAHVSGDSFPLSNRTNEEHSGGLFPNTGSQQTAAGDD
jgi:hypothetical protein